MSSGRCPTVYVIAGPNGAGKTTFATEFLPAFVHCREFVNANLIAAGLSPFAPETQALRAGRLALTRIRELADARQDFGFETTLAGRGYVKLIADLKRSDYRVVLFFTVAPQRRDGRGAGRQPGPPGRPRHPEATIRRRFEAGLRNFFGSYAALVDSWHLYDGSQLPPSCIATMTDGAIREHPPEPYRMIQAQWGN